MTEANSHEPTPVQLTRMEGILTLIMHKVDTLVPRVDRHEQEIGHLSLTVQSLSDGAKASAATQAVTAQALRDARESQRLQSERTWTPIQRVIALAVGIATVTNVAFLVSQR